LLLLLPREHVYFLTSLSCSKSGKTSYVRYLVKKAVDRFQKGVYIVGDRSKDNPFVPLSWHQLPLAKDAILIVEDLHLVSLKQYR
jgi:hypothetical protein